MKNKHELYGTKTVTKTRRTLDDFHQNLITFTFDFKNN